MVFGNGVTGVRVWGANSAKVSVAFPELTRDNLADLIAQLQCALREMHQLEKTRD